MNNLDQIKSLLTDVIKLSDGKIVININFFNTSGDAPPVKDSKPVNTEGSTWISVLDASRLFGFSDPFFYQLVQRHPEFRNQDNNIQCLLNRDLLEDYFRKHPEHKKNQKRYQASHEDIEALIVKSVAILKEDKKELYPERGVARSLRGNYYTYKEMSEKLGITYTAFNIKIRPLLGERLKNDIEYQNMLAEKGQENRTYDDLIEKAVDILDREGKTYKSYCGRNSNSDEYMSAKELAEKLDVPYHIFNDKIRPALQGEIYEKRHEGVERKIESWKKDNAKLSM